MPIFPVCRFAKALLVLFYFDVVDRQLLRTSPIWILTPAIHCLNKAAYE